MTQDRQNTRTNASVAERAAAVVEAPTPATPTPADAPADRGCPGAALPSAGKSGPAQVSAKPTKAAQLQALLASPDGATLARLCESLGWQAHTVRAALTRLRQAGHAIERSTTSNGQTVYRFLPSKPAKAGGARKAVQARTLRLGEAETASPAARPPEALDGGAA